MKHPLISANLKLLMKRMGFTNEQFADKFQVKRGVIESYTAGRAMPKAELTQRICNYFGITQDQLLKQKLTIEDLQVTGRIKSVTEVQLEEAHKRIELLGNTVKDLRKMIALLERK